MYYKNSTNLKGDELIEQESKVDFTGYITNGNFVDAGRMYGR